MDANQRETTPMIPPAPAGEAPVAPAPAAELPMIPPAPEGPAPAADDAQAVESAKQLITVPPELAPVRSPEAAAQSAPSRENVPMPEGWTPPDPTRVPGHPSNPTNGIVAALPQPPQPPEAV